VIQDGLKALLLDDDTLGGLIGSNLFAVVLPRGYTYPATVYHTFSLTEDYDNEGPTGHKEISLQLDSYGTSYASARNVANAAAAVLMPFVGTLSDGTKVKLITLTQDMDMPYIPSAEVKGTAYRVMQQFRLVFNDAE